MIGYTSENRNPAGNGRDFYKVGSGVYCCTLNLRTFSELIHLALSNLMCGIQESL